MKASNENPVEKKVSSRRKFLTKSSAGILIASLPAKSVWATGGNIAGSIIASGGSSDWSSSNAVCLRSHGYWKNHLSNIDSSYKNKAFKDAFNAYPIDDDHENIVVKRDSYGYKIDWHPTLKYCVQSEGNSGVYLSNKNNSKPFITDRNINKTCTGKYRKENRYGKDYPYFDFSGPDNVNAQMVTMYLNALYHGQYGINYPVLSAYGGPFATIADFADNLISMRNQHGGGAIGRALAQLIDQNPV
ncbi:hypothetical protein Q4575_13320 [Psychrosphaera sp. 1_MG-2023]|uniref:hypothetical protein n=1 Tax=Psychrosphaera sp. 1_MG-2023 TaxID=3062643 RepID=UPI0026E143DC|nr:hypothetical protein [Psychrosphaera sp. 1_MG-2023]MDO6720392.1 hypothetical protein [Psychrosphaera sp. 1_MG-2023]